MFDLCRFVCLCGGPVEFAFEPPLIVYDIFVLGAHS